MNTVSAPNVLSSDVEIVGTIEFEKELIFEGKLDGEILSEGSLVIGESAHIKGEVMAGTVTVRGNVEGNITATHRCELKDGAVLNGNLKTGRILIEEGATFIGRSEVTKTLASAKAAAPATPKPAPNAPAAAVAKP